MASDLERGALALADDGYLVFPCRPKTKEPAIKAWNDQATTDQDKIKEWWAKSKDYNVAIALDDRHFVADLEGNSRADVESVIGHKLPDTMSVWTPGNGGGEHLWYEKPADVEIKNRVRVLRNMDVRAKGGYVMAPPSVHPGGGRYRWGDSKTIVQAPDWLIEVCRRSKVGSEEHEELMSLSEMLSGIPRGMQRTAMFRWACSRRQKRYERDEVKIVLWNVAQNLEQDRSRPWTFQHIEKLVDDVWQRYEAPKEVRPQGPGKIWRVGELIDHPFATDNWVVKPILRRGVTLIASHAKRGKSMLVATFLRDLAVGQKVWGQFDCRPTGSLYLDLEQDEQAAADRWRGILGDNRPENLHVSFTWPRMDQGGDKAIREYLMAYPDIGIVVVDTWAMFNPTRPSESSSAWNAYYQEYDVWGQLKSIANEFSIALIVVHHFTKNGERPSGSAAVEGSVDGEWDLRREPKSSIAILDIKGKNVPETRIKFDVDLRSYAWNVTSVD